MVTLDDLDRKIIALLQQDGRRSYTDIASCLGVSEGTARQRTLRLLGSGVLQIVGVANPFRIGFTAMALVGIVVRLAESSIDALAAKISLLPEVSYVVMCTGTFDLMIEVTCETNEELKIFLTEKLHPLSGVERTETFMILDLYKMALGGWRLATDLPDSPSLRQEVHSDL